MEKKLKEENLVSKDLVLKESLVGHIDELRMVFFRKATKHFVQKIESQPADNREYLIGLISQFDYALKEHFYQQYITLLRGITMNKTSNHGFLFKTAFAGS